MDEQFTIGSLFSGIGGMEVGLESTGRFRTIWFSENDDYASAVLRKHWPSIPNLGDITKIDWRQVECPDVLTGGFPCQDISNAGKRKGITGERSGLWKEYLKAISILRPKFVIAENVSALRQRGLSTVLCDLAQVGYDAVWHCVPASHVGAPHRRDRIFILAYPHSDGFRFEGYEQASGQNKISEEWKAPAGGEWKGLEHEACKSGTVVQNSVSDGSTSSKMANAISIGSIEESDRWSDQSCMGKESSWWAVEPCVGRMADGIPNRVDRIKCLGNAIVPQVAAYVAGLALEQLARKR